MQLYKRLLLSYFPSTLSKNSVNPASMFISFIAAKEFFTIVHQRLIENYKINLFDVGIDIFDAKIGLGNEEKKTSQKHLDTYYGYLISANFNGYTFYNISNTSNALTLVAALLLQEVFEEKEEQLFIDCLYAFYLISFLFAGKIKEFPQKSLQEDFNRFLELFFSFYELVISQLGHKISANQFPKLKKKLIKKIEVFFMMFYYNKRISKYFTISTTSEDTSFEFFNWICNNSRSSTQTLFFNAQEESKYRSSFSQMEEMMLFDIAPGDILLKYLFLGNNPYELTNTLIASMYEKKKLQKLLNKLMKNESTLNELLEEVLNPKQFKEGYFEGIRKFIDSAYQHIKQEDEEALEEFHEMLSDIGEGEEVPVNDLKIPQWVKKESQILEQLLNFYITFTGGLTAERGDSFYLRACKPQLIQTLLTEINQKTKKKGSKSFYDIQHEYYLQNGEYYAQAHKKIRKNAEKSSTHETEKMKLPQSGFFSFELYKQENLLKILQDLNPRLCKLYLKKSNILKWFQETFGEEISQRIKQNKAEFIKTFYHPWFGKCKQQEQIMEILHNAITTQELTRLKDHLYTFDYWLQESYIKKIYEKNLEKQYDEMAILSLFALSKELLLGALIRYIFMQAQNAQEKEPLNLRDFLRLLIEEIFGIDENYATERETLFQELVKEYQQVIEFFIEFDDNREFLNLLRQNWKSFEKKTKKKAERFSREDVLRMRGVLQHITYYNKRFLIP